jgi:hypothetical protein
VYPLTETAKQNGLKPFAYFSALFEKTPPASSPQGWLKLLPWNIFNP